MKEKDWFDRIVELVKEDKELHDATVRLINSIAEGHEIKNLEKKRKSGLRTNTTSDSI